MINVRVRRSPHLLNPSGVGKTMLAKTVAQHIVKDKEKGFIRIDMSEWVGIAHTHNTPSSNHKIQNNPNPPAGMPPNTRWPV